LLVLVRLLLRRGRRRGLRDLPGAADSAEESKRGAAVGERSLRRFAEESRPRRAAGERNLWRCASDGSTMRRRKEQAPKTCGVRLICKFGFFFPFKFSS